MRHEGRHWFSTDVELDDVAVIVGTAGKRAARKAKNDIRRANQRERIEEWKREKAQERKNKPRGSEVSEQGGSRLPPTPLVLVKGEDGLPRAVPRDQATPNPSAAPDDAHKAA